MITDLLHYKLAYKLKLLLKNKNHSNLLIYGNQGSGKTMLIKDIFSVNGKKYNNCNFYLILTKNYYYFDCKSIKDKTSFINYLKDIIKKYNYFTSTNKYIILDHYEYVGDLIQNSLKVIIETAALTCKIIILTNNIGKVCNAIKSRCITMRIPLPKSIDKYILSARSLYSFYFFYRISFTKRMFRKIFRRIDKYIYI